MPGIQLKINNVMSKQLTENWKMLKITCEVEILDKWMDGWADKYMDGWMVKKRDNGHKDTVRHMCVCISVLCGKRGPLSLEDWVLFQIKYMLLLYLNQITSLFPCIICWNKLNDC